LVRSSYEGAAVKEEVVGGALGLAAGPVPEVTAMGCPREWVADIGIIDRVSDAEGRR
jgi:hypothetical protein